MSSSKHRQPGSQPSATDKSEGAAQPTVGKPGESLSSSGTSGRVAFDARGNPIWEWQTSTGVYERDVSTQRLKKLQAEELSIADTQSLKKPTDLALDEPTQLPGGGMNPYNTGPASKSGPTHLPKKHHHSHSMATHKLTPSKPAPQGAWHKLKSKLLREDD